MSCCVTFCFLPHLLTVMVYISQTSIIYVSEIRWPSNGGAFLNRGSCRCASTRNWRASAGSWFEKTCLGVWCIPIHPHTFFIFNPALFKEWTNTLWLTLAHILILRSDCIQLPSGASTRLWKSCWLPKLVRRCHTFTCFIFESNKWRTTDGKKRYRVGVVEAVVVFVETARLCHHVHVTNAPQASSMLFSLASLSLSRSLSLFLSLLSPFSLS